jgi:hypothetical protein
MIDLSQFELYSYPTGIVLDEDPNSKEPCGMPSASEPPRPVHAQVISIAPVDEPLHVALDTVHQEIVRTDDPEASLADFVVVPHGLSTVLVMLPRRVGLLVNGLPALSLNVLRPRDGLVMTPGWHTYVTQRIRPYLGPPPDEMLGQSCPYCRIPIAKDTYVFVHRCGVAYHCETAENRPDIAEEERLNCHLRMRSCFSCNQPVWLEERLVWDPASPS